jgi:hypothetical protein
MNGILLTSLRSVNQRSEIFKVIIAALKKEGHKLNTEVLETKQDTLEGMGEKELTELYRKVQLELRRSDFIICEISTQSSGLGFLVAQAISDHKPVLALMQSGSTSAPLPLVVKTSKFISFYEYSSPGDIDHIVHGFVRKIKRMVDYRFILLLHSNLEKYLEWASHNRYQPKSVIIRKAIEARMKEDEQYQKFLEEEKQYLID